MKLLKWTNYFILLFTAFSLQLMAGEDVLRPHGRPDGGRSNLPVYIGIEGGLNINMYSGDITFNGDNTILNQQRLPTTYDLMKDGTGLSPHIGIFADFSVARNMGVVVRVAWDRKYFENSGTGIDYNNVDPYPEVPVGIDWNVTANYFTISGLFRYNFNDNFFLTAGPIIHLLTDDLEYKSETNPKNASDITIWQRNFDESFSSVTQEKTRFGLEVGVGYKFPIARKIFLVPQARFQLMLSQTYKDDFIFGDLNSNTLYDTGEPVFTWFENRTQHSIQLALALMFEL